MSWNLNYQIDESCGIVLEWLSWCTKPKMLQKICISSNLWTWFLLGNYEYLQCGSSMWSHSQQTTLNTVVTYLLYSTSKKCLSGIKRQALGSTIFTSICVLLTDLSTNSLTSSRSAGNTIYIKQHNCEIPVDLYYNIIIWLINFVVMGYTGLHL